MPQICPITELFLDILKIVFVRPNAYHEKMSDKKEIPSKQKAKYFVTGPYYMDCPNPTEPDLHFTLISNILVYY